MKEYLVTQTILISIERPNAFTQKNNWGCIIRIVSAENNEEALGRFFIKTQDVKAVERLNPEMNLLSDIIKL